MTPAPGSADAPGRLDARPRRRIDLADLLPRLLSGLVMIAAAIGTAVTGGLAFAGFWGLAGIAILWEWQRLTGREGLGRRVAIGAAAVVGAEVVAASDHPAWAALVLLFGLGAVALGSARPLLSGVGVIYAGVLPAAVVILRRSGAYGLEAVFWLFAVVWATDIMAYFGGRMIGGPKLWPRVSPSKTWSGFLVGVVSGALAGFGIAALHGRSHWLLLPLGCVAGVVAQGGDLFESSLKRRFGAKDSSRLIPGHGGVMDRLDGFLAAAVFAVAFGAARLGVNQAAAGLLQW